MLAQYIQQLNKIQILSEAEEKSLWMEYKEKHNTEARHRLITSFQPLVLKMVKQITGDQQTNLTMDLIQEGNIGLISAVDAFDHRQGVKFTTYAVYRIKGRIYNYLEQGVGVKSISLDTQEEGYRLLEHLKLDALLPEDSVEQNILLSRIYKVIKMLPCKEMLIIQGLYVEDKKSSVLAEDLEISLSYLYRLRKKALRRIRGKLAHFIKNWSLE